jgi:centrin-1
MSSAYQRWPQCTKDELLEVRDAFYAFDNEQAGGLDARELKAAMSALNIDVSKDEIRNIYEQYGKDIRERVSLEEFMDIAVPRLPDRNSSEYIQKLFQSCDLDNNGKITARNLKRMAQELGEYVSDEELLEILEEADRDGDGYIGFNDFYKIMRRKEDNPVQNWS